VETGQAASVRGTTDEAGCVLGGAPSKDSWDSWNNDRDGVIRNAQSWNHTNRYYVGSEDLDANGHWVNVPEYGQVWSPTVAVAGFPIAPVAGSGSRTGTGRGSRTNLGLGALPLRPLVPLWQFLDVVAGTG